MKIIMSHDVDHITAWEHHSDLIIPKHMARNAIELGTGHISVREAAFRTTDLIRNKWHNLEELIEFDKSHEIPSTFFFGMKKGKCLAYGPSDAKYWSNKVIQNGFSVGVHGISFERFNEIKNEYDHFTTMTNIDNFGIRMHYLRSNPATLTHLASAGYKFDSSVYKFAPPFKHSSLWEFPLHVMDGYIFCKKNHWQNQNYHQAKEETKRLLEKAERSGIGYFTILFHDRYFSSSFNSWRKWYIWVIHYMKKNGLKFIDYNAAIKELEKNECP